MARATQSSSVSLSWTQIYFSASNFIFSGVVCSPGGVGPDRSELGLVSSLRRPSVSPSPSAARTRDVNVRNVIRSRKSNKTSMSGSVTAKSSNGTSTGTSVFSVTSRLERSAISLLAIIFSRRPFCGISWDRSSNSSKGPYSFSSNTAVLTPMPGTPGILSTLSPAKAWTSMTRSGFTPNFSSTSLMPISRFFMGSRIMTFSVTSCIRSLSELMIVQRAPASSACRA